jgi:hypothetical protein
MILDLVRPKPEARWVVCYSFADGPEKGSYYDVHSDRADALQTDDARLRHER